MVAIPGLLLSSVSIEAKNKFTVVLDPGHGGKDFGAIDNNTREKDINLAVAKKLGQLIEKKLKNTDVVFTRDNDSFVSLQGRADIANKSKGNLFISIHTNSVDLNNKNRATIEGASVYTLGSHKDDANMEVARRENAVIEMENGYDQKYSGFDPSRDESYIIFELAQKQNIAQSNRFAKNVQDNLVKIAGRKNRGVHQAGFWVLWATSMPSVLVELDFICNPESAKYMTSKEGVDKMADAIFQAVKVYEQNYMQAQRMALSQHKSSGDVNALLKEENERVLHAGAYYSINDDSNSETGFSSDELNADDMIGLAFRPESSERDLSHSRLEATQNQKRARHNTDGRRRRSESARQISESRNVEGSIALLKEFTGKSEKFEPENKLAISSNSSASTSKDTKKKKNQKEKAVTSVKDKNSSKKLIVKNAAGKENSEHAHAGKRKSLRSKASIN